MENTLTKKRFTIPGFEDFLKKVSEHPKKSREEIILELKEIMSRYEQKYRMSTEEFIPRFNNGEFEMDDNYLDYELLDWWSSYETYLKYSKGEK